jgi:hypothetical protein
MLSGLLRRGGPPQEKHGVRGVFVWQAADGTGWAPVAGLHPTLAGQWDRGLWALPPGADPADPAAPRTPVWTVVPRTGTPNRHDMADFALRLNELTPELDRVSPSGRLFLFSFSLSLSTLLPPHTRSHTHTHARFTLTHTPHPLKWSGPTPDRLAPPAGHARPGGRPL